MNASIHSGRTAWTERLCLSLVLGALASTCALADTVIREVSLPGLVAWEVDNAFAPQEQRDGGDRGELLVMGLNGLLYAVDAASGAQRWRFMASVDLVDSAFVSARHVIAVDRERRLVWLDKRSGQRRAHAEVFCLTTPQPYRWTDRDYLCVGVAEGKTAPGGAESAAILSYELERSSEGAVRPVWRVPAPGLIPQSLTVVQARSGPGVIVFGVKDKRGGVLLRVLSFKGGEPIWQSSFSTCTLRGRMSMPLRTYGKAPTFSLIATTEEGAYSNVYRLDVLNGSPRGNERPLIKLHGRLAAPPVVGRNGTTFVWTRRGQGWVLDPKRQKVARIDLKKREFYVGPALAHDENAYSYAASGQLGMLTLRPNPDLFLPMAPLMWEDERLASRRLLHITDTLQLPGLPLGPPAAVSGNELSIATVGRDGQARLSLVSPGVAADAWKLKWTFTCTALGSVDCFLAQPDTGVVFGEGLLAKVSPSASTPERVPGPKLRGYQRAFQLDQGRVLLLGKRVGLCDLTILSVQESDALPLEPGERCVNVGVGSSPKWACLCTDKGRIACLDLETRALWSDFGEPLPNGLMGDPVVSGDEAFVASGNKLLVFRLPGPRGRPMRPERTFVSAGAIEVQPVRAGHRLFWTTSTSVYSIDLKQHPDARECVRVFDSDSPTRRFFALQALSDDRLCAAFGQGVLVLECHETGAGVRLHSGVRSEQIRGAEIWQRDAAQMALAGETICIAAGRWVYGLCSKTADILWHVPFPSRVAGLTARNGIALACSVDGRVKCIRPPRPADVARQPRSYEARGEDGAEAVFKPPRGQAGEADDTHVAWAKGLASKLQVDGRPIHQVLEELARNREALKAPNHETIRTLQAVKRSSMDVYLIAKAERKKGRHLGLRSFFKLSGKSLRTAAGLANDISKELDRAAKKRGILGGRKELKDARSLVASISFYLPKLTEWSGEAERSFSTQDARWWRLRAKVRPFDTALKKLDKWSEDELDFLIAGYATQDAKTTREVDASYEKGYIQACKGSLEAAAKQFEGLSDRESEHYNAAWWIMGTLWWQQNDVRAADALSRVSPDFAGMTAQERELVRWLSRTRGALLAAQDLSQLAQLATLGKSATPARRRFLRYLREEKFLQSWSRLCPVTVPVRSGYRHFRLTIEAAEDMRAVEPALKIVSYTRDNCLEEIVLSQAERAKRDRDVKLQSAALARQIEKALQDTYARQSAQLQAALGSGRAGDWHAFMKQVHLLARGAEN